MEDELEDEMVKELEAEMETEMMAKLDEYGDETLRKYPPPLDMCFYAIESPSYQVPLVAPFSFSSTFENAGECKHPKKPKGEQSKTLSRLHTPRTERWGIDRTEQLMIFIVAFSNMWGIFTNSVIDEAVRLCRVAVDKVIELEEIGPHLIHVSNHRLWTLALAITAHYREFGDTVPDANARKALEWRSLVDKANKMGPQQATVEFKPVSEDADYGGTAISTKQAVKKHGSDVKVRFERKEFISDSDLHNDKKLSELNRLLEREGGLHSFILCKKTPITALPQQPSASTYAPHKQGASKRWDKRFSGGVQTNRAIRKAMQR